MKFKSGRQRRGFFARLHFKKGWIPDKKFNKVQLRKGILVEREHTNDLGVAKQIAKAHLSENSAYYKILDRVGL